MPNKNLVLKQGINLLLFGGKGGVGKTTIAASTALEAARQGKKVLVFSTDPAHSLSDSFDCPIGGRIVNVAKNVDALEIDAEAELKKFREEHEDLIKKIEFKVGLSQDILPTLDGTFQYILVDGDHEKSAARADLEHAARLCEKDGLILFDDIADSPGECGLIDVWESFSKDHPEFQFRHTMIGKGLGEAWKL